MSNRIKLTKSIPIEHHYLEWDPAKYMSPKQAAMMNLSYPYSRLRLVYRVLADWSDNEQTIFITLENSEITSGGLFTDSNHYRGYFQDSVRVRMSVDHDDMTLYSDGPQDVNGSATTTSSVSVSNSISANVGFFDEAATGGLSASSTFSKGSSCSASLLNFEVRNRSARDVDHEYRMATTADGTKYDNPYDLFIPPDGPTAGKVFAALFNPAALLPDRELRDVPNRAKDNMPLISQAVWKNQSGTPIKERVKLSVNIVQGMTCAWADTPDISKGFKHPDPVVSQQAKYSHEIVVDLAKIAGMPHQTGTVL